MLQRIKRVTDVIEKTAIMIMLTIMYAIAGIVVLSISTTLLVLLQIIVLAVFGYYGPFIVGDTTTNILIAVGFTVSVLFWAYNAFSCYINDCCDRELIKERRTVSRGDKVRVNYDEQDVEKFLTQCEDVAKNDTMSS